MQYVLFSQQASSDNQFVCHHNTMFIYQSLHTPTLDRFNAVTHASTGMSLICCLLMAVTGYLIFTDKTQGNILNNFGPDDLMINIARLCFGANMSTTRKCVASEVSR